MWSVFGWLAVFAAACGATGLSGHSAEASLLAEARQRELEAEWGAALEEKKKVYVSPVKRVVNLLQKMKAQLEAEASKEAEMHDSMACWCKTGEKEKAQAVSDADAADVELSAEIEGRSARFGELGTGIAKMKEEIQANTATLDRARAIREEEAAKFNDMETEMMQYVTNLKNAIAVLTKHQSASMLQLDEPTLSGLRVLLRDAALGHDLLAAGRAERRGAAPVALISLRGGGAASGAVDRQTAVLLQALDPRGSSVSSALPLKLAERVVTQAAAGPHGAFLQKQPANFESRSSLRSSQIYGILQQMLSDFQSELTVAQKEEIKAKEDFKALAAAKTAEIEAGKRKLDDMEVEHASNQKGLSDAKEMLGVTREQRSGDVEFLRNLKLKCNDLDSDWEKRSKTRAAETKAVAEAIAILTEDDNREHLAKTVSLLQLASSGESDGRARRTGAAAALRRAALDPSFETDDLLAAWDSRRAPAAQMLGAAGGPRAQLSTLATSVQLDSFTKVKELMDKMIADLKDQQAEEVKFKDDCTEELDATEKELYSKGQSKKDLEATRAHLEGLIQKLEGDIEAARSQIAEAQREVKKAGEQREQENKEFQAVVSDQRATQHILAKALARLKDFYQKKIGKEVLLQRGEPTPPVHFNNYTVNAGSTSVIGLLEQIIEDSKRLEAEAMESEKTAQAAYEAFIMDSNRLIGALQEGVVKNAGNVAASKSEFATAGADLQSVTDELESFTAYEGDLHERCDFIIKNFDTRQSARLQEIEAIQQAKAILSGAAEP